MNRDIIFIISLGFILIVMNIIIFKHCYSKKSYVPKKIDFVIVIGKQINNGEMTFKDNDVNFTIFKDNGEKFGGNLKKDLAIKIIKKGEHDGTILSMSHSDEYISQRTGFSVDQIKNLRN